MEGRQIHPSGELWLEWEEQRHWGRQVCDYNPGTSSRTLRTLLPSPSPAPWSSKGNTDTPLLALSP